MIVGVLFAMEYLCVGKALQYTSTRHVGVFLCTALVFAALGLHWKLPSERLKAIMWCGIGVAFLGIVVAFPGHDPSTPGKAGGTLSGDLLALAGGASYGATTL